MKRDFLHSSTYHNRISRQQCELNSDENEKEKNDVKKEEKVYYFVYGDILISLIFSVPVTSYNKIASMSHLGEKMNLVFHYCYLQSLAGAGFLFPANQSSEGVSGTMSCQQKYIGVCVFMCKLMRATGLLVCSMLCVLLYK